MRSKFYLKFFAFLILLTILEMMFKGDTLINFNEFFDFEKNNP
jgi:hypothetical protein